MKSGETVEIEYDIPGDAKYFEANSHPSMPQCFLMEAALQPCGVPTLFEVLPLSSEDALYIRNIDGTGTMTEEVGPHSSRLTTLTSLSRNFGVTLVNFTVVCMAEEIRVLEIDTWWQDVQRSSSNLSCRGAGMRRDPGLCNP